MKWRVTAALLAGLIAAALPGTDIAFAKKAAAAPAVSVDQQAMAILNAYRTSKGLSALRVDAKLNKVAADLAAACAAAGNCDHNTGGSFSERLKAAGYSAGYGAENLRKNEKTVEGAFNWWKGSQVHNTNMLMKPLKALGFAHSVSAKGKGFYVLVMAD
jgi:uncharacterized protein YkwD